MTDYTVVQSATASDPAQPGDSVTLTCSLFSDSVKTSCGDEHSVLWFRVGSEKSHPNIIYAEGNRRDGCDKKPDARSPAMSCFYSFSKTVSSSDAGTYYCAVASCGEILFGNGTKLDIEGNCIFIVQLVFPYYWILFVVKFKLFFMAGCWGCIEESYSLMNEACSVVWWYLMASRQSLFYFTIVNFAGRKNILKALRF